ncbi:hypothetical protein ACFSQQ_00030 [Mesorhizobium kowhaii]|uniref:hypothetical protein n=1 Tax=Mesorhizobium kowhaii TaxID=1300272 RepID=UPI0035EA8D84
MFKRTIVSGLIVAAGSLAGTVRPSAAHGYHHHPRNRHCRRRRRVRAWRLLAQQPRTLYLDEYSGSW